MFIWGQWGIILTHCLGEHLPVFITGRELYFSWPSGPHIEGVSLYHPCMNAARIHANPDLIGPFKNQTKNRTQR